MIEFKIDIERGGCIACGACYSTDPAHFEPDDNGKSKVVGGETDDSGSFGKFNDDEFENAKTAEDNCPVGIIIVTEL